MLRNSYCCVLALDLIARTYVDALPWISWGAGEDQSLWSVKGCAMSDLAHFLRVGLGIDQLASFRKLSRAFCVLTPFRAAFAAWLAFAALLPGLPFPKDRLVMAFMMGMADLWHQKQSFVHKEGCN